MHGRARTRGRLRDHVVERSRRRLRSTRARTTSGRELVIEVEGALLEYAYRVAVRPGAPGQVDAPLVACQCTDQELVARVRGAVASVAPKLRADVEVAALAGIGNEARPDAIDDVLARVDHADPLVRTQAAATLRAFDDERARETLLEMLADDDDAVAIAALGALTDHQLGVDGSARLAAIAHSGAHHPRLAGALVSALGRRLADDPSVRSSLATLAARSDDARLRARVDRLLAT